MSAQLNGRIFWIESDFSYIGEDPRDEISHSVGKVENCVIDPDRMIKFFTPPIKVEGMECSYNVNLLIDENGHGFSGSFSKEKEPSFTGNVSCDLFSNDKSYMLYGRWQEDDRLYTWWAVISRSRIS